MVNKLVVKLGLLIVVALGLSNVHCAKRLELNEASREQLTKQLCPQVTLDLKESEKDLSEATEDLQEVEKELSHCLQSR